MRILLADDDRAVRRVFQFKLEKRGHNVTTVEDGAQAIDRIRADRYDVLVSDIRMPNVDGLELLERARGLQPDLKVVLITAHATVSQAVQAVKIGAFDYITKPFEDEEFYAVIDRAGAFRTLEEENKSLRGRLRATEAQKKLIGVSASFKEMMHVVDRIAPTEATVLLLGPSGTGKEMIARTIHAKSLRGNEPFIAVNCGAIPRDLVESELFGHVKGAFTGAIRDKKGRFEQADGGTILLDEIGELAGDVQVKLLRVLQERVVEPVGGERAIEVNVRVIAATNVDLDAQVAHGQFREDLFYRINVVPIRIPALRDRATDIPVLARAFLQRYAGPDSNVTLSPELLRCLASYSWPGNVRELENLVERMVLLRQSDVLEPADLPEEFGSGPLIESASGNGGGGSTFHEAEEKLVRDALQAASWNRSQAARNLGIARHVLIYRMKKYGIHPPERNARR